MRARVGLARVLPLRAIARRRQGEAGDMTFIVPVSATISEERMSRKLSLATMALSAMLLAVPAVAQQPAAKDSTKAAATTKPHAKKHKKSAKSEMAKPAAKDSTKK
jgi:hypothetical protein